LASPASSGTLKDCVYMGSSCAVTGRVAASIFN
jgi:hypothetical protein